MSGICGSEDQPSLRDSNGFAALVPKVETLGYSQRSLRGCIPFSGTSGKQDQKPHKGLAKQGFSVRSLPSASITPNPLQWPQILDFWQPVATAPQLRIKLQERYHSSAR